jgi:hypothetical protein
MAIRFEYADGAKPAPSDRQATLPTADECFAGYRALAPQWDAGRDTLSRLPASVVHLGVRDSRQGFAVACPAALALVSSAIGVHR